MKVIDLQQKITQLLPNNLDANIFPFITDYYTNAQKYDRMFYKHYGLKDLIESIETSTDWENEVTSVLFLYKEQLRHFWEINIAEYSPIDNVFEDTVQTTHREEHTETMTTGEQTSSETLGSRTDTDNYGTNGLTGNSTTTTTNKTVPYDTNVEKETSATVSGVINTELESQRTSGEQINKANTGERIDKTESSPQHEVVQINRHGNIGTTLSTDIMLGSEKYWRNFTFFSELFLLINRELCEGVW